MLQTNKYFSDLTQYGGFARNATMNADMAFHQRIGRLTPLADVLAAIDRVEAVAPRATAMGEAAGRVLAADILAQQPLPPATLALGDGWAVESEATRDAGPYAPHVLHPRPQRLDAFATLPPGTDAVAPLDAVSTTGGMMQLMASTAPGEGTLPAGADATTGMILRKGGTRLRACDIAALTAACITRATIRQPLIHIVNTKRGDTILDATAALIMHAIVSAGAAASLAGDLDSALCSSDADAVIGIGGTGTGRSDRSVTALARAGSVICHGIALSPGQTAAFGTAGNGHPVLLVPGRLDAALACWLMLGRPLIDRLSGAQSDDESVPVMLTRKIASTVGIAEMIPLRRDGAGVSPLASGYLPLQALACADGWMLVPPQSEGYPAGTGIQMRPLP